MALQLSACARKKHLITPFVNYLARTVIGRVSCATRGPVEHSEETGGDMTALSLQASRLTGRGKTMLARAISGRFFAGDKEQDAGDNAEAVASGRVYPFPAPVESVADLRTRLALAEERLTELKALLEDMRRDRDAWREQAQTRAPASSSSESMDSQATEFPLCRSRSDQEMASEVLPKPAGVLITTSRFAGS